MGAYLDLRGWVDLGLPSGKLWCFDNEEGYFTFDEAAEKFQDQLPTIKDWNELIDNTTQRFDKRRKGLVLKAPNGKKLFLPAMVGYYTDANKRGIYSAGNIGYYWSATPYDENEARDIMFGHLGVYTIGYDTRSCSFSVRLIKSK